MAAMSSARVWFTRLRHRIADTVDILAFSLCPTPSLSTTLSVRSFTLQLQQWPGRKAGSGGFVWGASRRLALHFENHGDGCAASPHMAAVLGRAFKGMTVLELGAGTGAAGLVAASLGADVTLTDQASFCFPGNGDGPCNKPKNSLLDLMRVNVRHNADALLERTPEVFELLWGEDEHIARLKHKQYDIICGADILLFHRAQPALIHTLRCLSGASTVVLIEHTDRSGNTNEYPKDMRDFLDALADDGLWLPSVIRDHGRHITIRMVRAQSSDALFRGTLIRSQ